KWVEGLTAETAVADAARAVLAARFEAVRHFLPLAVEKPYQDMEHVHQLRVATRRAGAALRVFRDCLPRRAQKEVKQQSRAIRRAAGDARDWDVFLLGLPRTKAFTAARARPALDYLIGYGMGERSAAQTRLVETAQEVASEFAESSATLPDSSHPPRGDQPAGNFGELAVTRFGELLRAFDETVKANPTEPTALHQLRILGKRARYTLEIFVDCFPPAFRDAVYPAIEEVQELLGVIQDSIVGINRLKELRLRIRGTIAEEWPRLQNGIEGLSRELRSRITSGRKAFQRWRKDWMKLMEGMQLEVAAAVVVA
ncbi:MAG TPA: CHAD domain-containing protein, partial [Gemmata sp.]|nr:CHAD domain-containing protein [Gemmata sp.]